MISGEYFVLDGALALAVPTRYGQFMTVAKHDEEGLLWRSLDEKGECWFEGHFTLPQGEYIKGTDGDTGKYLEKMFAYIRSENPLFLDHLGNTLIETQLEFPREWGLGSSSTLLYNLAEWSGVDAYELSNASLGGSGYDIACAGAKNPIQYQIQNGKPYSRKAAFNPVFKEHLYFVHLGRKQNSRDGIKHYQKRKRTGRDANNISIITKRMQSATTLSEFKHLMAHHETLISSVLGMPKVKDQRFPDFWGGVKSLGAWGGDFVMVASGEGWRLTEKYFKDKGYEVFIPYEEMVL